MPIGKKIEERNKIHTKDDDYSSDQPTLSAETTVVREGEITKETIIKIHSDDVISSDTSLSYNIFAPV